MIGQYTLEEVLEMKGTFSSLKRMVKHGIIVRLHRLTRNFYREESDGSWTNYDCKTITPPDAKGSHPFRR